MKRSILNSILCGLVLLAPSGTATSAESWIVKNQRLAVTFGAEARGAVASLVDQATGRELAAQPARPLLFQLEFSSPDSPQRLTLGNADAESIEFTRPDAAADSAESRETRSEEHTSELQSL